MRARVHFDTAGDGERANDHDANAGSAALEFLRGALSNSCSTAWHQLDLQLERDPMRLLNTSSCQDFEALARSQKLVRSSLLFFA